MSSDSEEENGLRHGPEDSDEGRDDRRSRSRSRSRSPAHSQSRSRSHSRSESPLRREEDAREEITKPKESSRDREDITDRKENGMRGDSDAEENEVRRQASRSKSPEENEGWRGSTTEKRVSRSRSKSKQKEKEMSKERDQSDRKSSSKKKSRTKRSRSRSRSRRRSNSRSRRSRSKNRKRSRSRSRSRGSSFDNSGMAPSSRNVRRSTPGARVPDMTQKSRRRSRSRSRRRSRSRSRSGTPVDGARLHVAELDVDTRKRDLERVFEKYGRLREIWMARNPPCFAFVVYAHQRDADKALKETDGIMIGHCRIKVTQARPRVRGGRMRGGYDPNLRCYQCGELGHFSRNCTDTKFGYKRPPTPPGAVH